MSTCNSAIQTLNRPQCRTDEQNLALYRHHKANQDKGELVLFFGRHFKVIENPKTDGNILVKLCSHIAHYVRLVGLKIFVLLNMAKRDGTKNDEIYQQTLNRFRDLGATSPAIANLACALLGIPNREEARLEVDQLRLEVDQLRRNITDLETDNALLGMHILRLQQINAQGQNERRIPETQDSQHTDTVISLNNIVETQNTTNIPTQLDENRNAPNLRTLEEVGNILNNAHIVLENQSDNSRVASSYDNNLASGLPEYPENDRSPIEEDASNIVEENPITPETHLNETSSNDEGVSNIFEEELIPETAVNTDANIGSLITESTPQTLQQQLRPLPSLQYLEFGIQEVENQEGSAEAVVNNNADGLSNGFEENVENITPGLTTTAV